MMDHMNANARLATSRFGTPISDVEIDRPRPVLNVFHAPYQRRTEFGINESVKCTEMYRFQHLIVKRVHISMNLILVAGGTLYML